MEYPNSSDHNRGYIIVIMTENHEEGGVSLAISWDALENAEKNVRHENFNRNPNTRLSPLKRLFFREILTILKQLYQK